MPTTITGQNGKVTKLKPVIAVSGCGVKVVGHKVIGNTAYLTIQTFAPGRISGSGKGVSTVARSLAAESRAATLKVPLSSGGRRRHKPLKVKIRVGLRAQSQGRPLERFGDGHLPLELKRRRPAGGELERPARGARCLRDPRHRLRDYGRAMP